MLRTLDNMSITSAAWVEELADELLFMLTSCLVDEADFLAAVFDTMVKRCWHCRHSTRQPPVLGGAT